ncbi:hypothetical protein EVAR_98016_1 [Eumeta japonica]|uniref:Uncharacterized protein n=1 Tax=Eumeta variegata TaxID=151549 RepID=A0A4C1WL20_EUMVA|nr:hypothetical protein EVAR_98016_1 [Eumeta japonica]
MTITTFREKVIDAMLIKYATFPEPPPTPAPKITSHLLVNNLVKTPPKLKRGKYKNCYTKCGKKGKADSGQRKFAAQVTTISSIFNFFLQQTLLQRSPQATKPPYKMFGVYSLIGRPPKLTTPGMEKSTSNVAGMRLTGNKEVDQWRGHSEINAAGASVMG